MKRSPATAGRSGPSVDKPARVADDEFVDLYHATKAAHAQNIRANGINLAVQRVRTDFGRGFYLTDDLAQAHKWMVARFGTRAGVVLHYRVLLNELRALHGRAFDSADAGWESLVREMRSGSAPMHSYDWVEGPMLRNIQKFLKGNPARADGQQISIHTPNAVELFNRSLLGHDVH